MPSISIRLLSGFYLSQNTVPQTYDGPSLAETFPLNLTIFHTILSPSHPERYYMDLLCLVFVRNCMTNCMKKWFYRSTPWGITKLFSKSLILFSWLQKFTVSNNSSAKSGFEKFVKSLAPSNRILLSQAHFLKHGHCLRQYSEKHNVHKRFLIYPRYHHQAIIIII